MVLVEGSGLMGGAVIGALPPLTMSILSIGSLVTMITMVSMCTTCCKKKVKNSDPDEVAYGVIVVSEDVPKAVQFRDGSQKNVGERFSQPVAKSSSNSAVPSRISAPPVGQRALPRLPDSTYSAINKNRSEKEIEYADGPATQLYESIDRDNDSMVDPLYSKVTENRSTRRYDYPVFMKNTRAKETDDPFYQSASQIYAPGSEDPYSSIASEPRIALAQQEDDSSSAYDPGYAKVKTSTKADREKTEAELDQLYSKIRRNERRDADSPLPGTSHQIDLIQTNGEVSREDLGRVANGQEGDDTSGREPSYRYITVRESAEVIRERLRQQGQLGPGGLPIREHYYSTIGNEYETVDGTSTTYSRLREQQPSSTINSHHSQLTPPSALSISVNPAGEYAPAPPTSPIPERTPELFDRLQQGSSRTPEDSTGLMYSVIRKTPTGPSPTIPTVVKPPSRSRPNSESHESVVVRPSVVVSSANRSLNQSINQSINQQNRQSNQGEYCEEIQSFMNRPVLPYRAEALVNKRVTEERETVTEERRSRGPMPDPPISKSASREFSHYCHSSPNSANRFSATSIGSNQGLYLSSESEVDHHHQRVHNVEIQRIQERHQPLLNEHIVQIKAIQEQRPATLQIEQKSTPGPSSPLGNVGSERYASAERNNGSMSARGGSQLPIAKNETEVKEQIGRSRQRRQESIEREQREEKEKMNRERRRREKIEEELKKEKMGTVYTANDYVSPYGFTSDRGWPLVAPDLSPSRDPSRPSSRANTPAQNVMIMSAPSISYIQNSSMLLIDFPSESEGEDGGGGECEDGTCFCHSKSPSREAVSRSNRRQMVEISLDSPHPNILPPFNIL